jgi:hypothetical protein
MKTFEFDFVLNNARDGQEIARNAGEMMDARELREYIMRSRFSDYLSNDQLELIARTVEAEVGVRMVMA